MGHKDLVKLHKIYEEIKKICKEYNWHQSFVVDDGRFETRIDIHSNGHWVRGNGKLPLISYEMFCPDLIDFNKKCIIEFEEEAKANTGYFNAKKHKGHVQETLTVRDEVRDEAYGIAGFQLHKIWESDFKSGKWKEYLKNFLGRFYNE